MDPPPENLTRAGASSEPWIGNCPKCHTAYRTNPPEIPLAPLRLKCGRPDCGAEVVMTPIVGFPEAIEETRRADAGWERAHELDAKLAEIRDAVRNMRDVKGRFHTQLATERLIALLPENADLTPPETTP